MDQTSLSLHAKRFFSGTLLSRMSGMARDLSMAFAFGDHPSVAAFMVAFRLSNLFRRLLGEGPLQSAFIPYFEGLRLQDSAKATTFFRQLSLLVLFLLIFITCVGEIGLWSFSSYFSPENREILTLTAWMLPGLLFICLYGLNISLLHCHDTFFIPSFAPFVCNVIWILGALLLQSQPAPFAMQNLAKLVVVGFFGQWLLTLPWTLKFAPLDLKLIFNLKIPKEVKELAKLFAYGAVGVGAVQINALIDSMFARHADLRGPIYLWYSIRIEQLALAIFGIACVSTIVPRLSRAIKNNDLDGAQGFFTFSYKRILTVMIPCSFAIFALGGNSIDLIYGRGSFTDFAVSQTTLCLWAYTIGLLPTTMVILYSALFFARNDFKTPLKISLYTIALNIFFNALFIFVFKLGAISTALATSISSWINFCYLQKEAKKEGWKPAFPLSKIAYLVCASVFSGACVVAVEHSFLKPTVLPLLMKNPVIYPRVFLEQAFNFTLCFVAFIGGIIGYSVIFKNRELIELYQAFSPLKKKKLDKV